MTDREKILRERLGNSWYEKLKWDFDQKYMDNISSKIGNRRGFRTIYPDPEDTFNAFKLTPFEKVKVVIIGQDPYHTPSLKDPKKGIAHGLAFSSQDPTILPPSLENIFKEVEEDIKFGLYLKGDYDLSYWAEQGVFLLNTVLTVDKGVAGSHSTFGWQEFTTRVVKLINAKPDRVVWMLWGKDAKEFKSIISDEHHLVLEAAHPAAEQYRENAGFFGTKPFSKANEFLKKYGYGEISW